MKTDFLKQFPISSSEIINSNGSDIRIGETCKFSNRRDKSPFKLSLLNGYFRVAKEFEIRAVPVGHFVDSKTISGK